MEEQFKCLAKIAHTDSSYMDLEMATHTKCLGWPSIQDDKCLEGMHHHWASQSNPVQILHAQPGVHARVVQQQVHMS